MAMHRPEQQYYQQPMHVVVVNPQEDPRPLPGTRIWLIVYNAFVLLTSAAALGVGIMFFVLNQSNLTMFNVWGGLMITVSLLFVAYSIAGLIGAVQHNASLLLAAFIVGILAVLLEIGVALWAFLSAGDDTLIVMMRIFAGLLIFDALIRVIAVVYTWKLRSAILNPEPPVVVGQPMMVGGESPQHIVLVQPSPQDIIESQPHQPPPMPPIPMKGPAPKQH